MSFTRTSSGLANQCLFYNVDAVVFTEGGNVSWSIEDIKSGRDNFNDKSIDILFWRKLFNKFKSDINLKFKAVGSKTTVSAIALEIQTNNITTVIAAMDSEFDSFYNNKIEHPNILYTRGYSWENDVWDSGVTISILEDLSGETIDHEIVENCINDFHEAIYDGVCADAVLFGSDSSFLPRKRHLKCVMCSEHAAPIVKSEFIEVLINEIGLDIEDAREFAVNNQITSDLFCYGHLINDFYYHMVRFISRVILEIKVINKELLENMAISKFEQIMCNEKSEYYQNQIVKTMPNNTYAQ